MLDMVRNNIRSNNIFFLRPLNKLLLTFISSQFFISLFCMWYKGERKIWICVLCSLVFLGWRTICRHPWLQFTSKQTSSSEIGGTPRTFQGTQGCHGTPVKNHCPTSSTSYQSFSQYRHGCKQRATTHILWQNLRSVRAEIRWSAISFFFISFSTYPPFSF